MHGSPLSKWDNRYLWKKYNYRDFGIIAEPYFDVDFSEVLYLTDTGRRWDGDEVSVRDKVEGTEIRDQKSEVGDPQITQISADYLSLTENTEAQRSPRLNTLEGAPVPLGGEGGDQRSEIRDIKFRKTEDIIEAAEKGLLPDKIMLNVHPQRWDDKPWPWVKGLVWQNVKNVVKKYFFVKK